MQYRSGFHTRLVVEASRAGVNLPAYCEMLVLNRKVEITL